MKEMRVSETFSPLPIRLMGHWFQFLSRRFEGAQIPLRPMGTDLELTRIAKFAAVGVLNGIVGLGVIFSCKYFGQVSDAPANAIGYVVAVINSFFWNRRWTFEHAGSTGPAAIRFLLVFCIAYVANLITALVAIRFFEVNSYLAHALATIPYTALFYLGSRFFAFSR